MTDHTESGAENDGQLYVWKGYTGKVEIVSFKTFLSRPVKRVTLGEDHSLILTHDDHLFACGSNEHGQLGREQHDRTYSFDPCLVDTVSGQGIADIACGSNHSACVLKDGQIYVWGDNQFGQCGFKSTAEDPVVTSPVLLELTHPEMTCPHGVTSPGKTEKCVRIAFGYQHSMALSATGNVWVWGKGPQLGLGENGMSWTPVILETFCDKNVVSITCGDFHNVVLVEEMNQEQKQQNKHDSNAENVVNYTCSECQANTVLSPDKASPVVQTRKNAKKTGDIRKGVKSSEQSGDIGVDQNAMQEETIRDDVGAIAEPNVQLKGNKLELGNVEERKEVPVEGFVDQGYDVPYNDNNQQSHSDKKTDVKADITADTKEDMKTDSSTDGDQAKVEEQPAPKVEQESSTSVDSGTSSKDVTKDVPLIKTDDTEDDQVQMRPKKSESIESNADPLNTSAKSDGSRTSVTSTKSHKSCGILDESGAREFLARQFQDDDEDEVSFDSSPSYTAKDKPTVTTKTASSNIPASPASPGAFMMQTMTSLTSQMSNMTTKAFSNIASVPGKFRFSSTSGEEEGGKASVEASEMSELASSSSENINLEYSILDFSNLADSSSTINTSLLSLQDSETSFSSAGSVESSPVKRKSSTPRKSVSKESESIRTIEAKQENLRKKSQSALSITEEEENSTDVTLYTLDTEVWCWGKNSKGQLGLGDMLDRNEPTCLQILTGRRVVKVSCGSLHTVAISSTGEVYSWGLNDSGQLAHTEMSSSPARAEIPSDCCVWDIDAGSNHSVFLIDNASTSDSRPDVYYAGKHPCKDLYVPIFKTQRLSYLKFLKKTGWISSVVTGGDNCACVSRRETQMTVVLYQLTRALRDIHRQLHNIMQDLVKRIQISGYFKGFETQPYKSLLQSLISTYTQLTKKLGSATVELTTVLCRGDSLLGCSIFTEYESYLTALKHYSTSFEDMVATGAFEFIAKNASQLFETLQEFYLSLLPGSKPEEKPDHAAKFRKIMYTPLEHVKNISQIIKTFSDQFEKSSKESNLLSSVHLNLEHFLRTSKLAVTDADNTKKFWESASTRIADNHRSPSRRLIKESKSCPLTLVHAGRFSSHNFYLFNDIFIHSHYSGFQSYPLETVWVDVPSADNASHQNMVTITTPDDVLSVTAQSALTKVEWVVAFNTAINKVLASQKSVKRQNSGEFIHTPVIRLATHTFTKHALYKDATYKGFWLNGKVHGTGMLKWPDGRKYKGKFRHGSITGSGRMLIPKDNNTDEIQEGMWKDAKLHGHGKIKYNSGDLYDGYFKDGLRHGHGVYRKGRHTSSASYIYVGEWLHDKKHGYGVMDDVLKGEKYMGMWQEDNRHGNGVVVTLDGMYFEGNFQVGKLVGHGLMLTDDNSCYEGEFAGITLLQGKGCLTLPTDDKIEGIFNGTWNQGLKITGSFIKVASSTSQPRHCWSMTSLETKSSLYGKLSVRPDRKWEEIFYQCFESLGYSGDGEPNTAKAWDQVVSNIVAGKQRLKDRDKQALTFKQKLELVTLEELEKVPAHGNQRLTIEHIQDINQYLAKACDTVAHPLGKLIDELVDVFRAAYIGIGAHPRLLQHAMHEILSYMKRIYKVIRILFPELPTDGQPTNIYPARCKRESTPMGEDKGFLARQVSETEEDVQIEILSSVGVLQPIIMPKIYPALFDLYALHCHKDDDKYWDRIQKLNKQGDISLMAYLGIEQPFWCMDEALFKDKNTRISSIKDHSYSKCAEVLQQISTAFCPLDKLQVIQRTFLTITQTVQEFMEGEHMWCMDDLFPIFQFVVIRARIHHLGAEIHFVEELMENYLEFGELGIMFTTLKACYFQIQNEKMPTH